MMEEGKFMEWLLQALGPLFERIAFATMRYYAGGEIP